jgi:hypothetical protein
MSELELNKYVTEVRIGLARIEEILKGVSLKNDSDHEYIKKQLVNHNEELIETRAKIFNIEKDKIEQQQYNEDFQDAIKKIEEHEKKLKKLETTSLKLNLFWKLLAPFGGAGAGILVTLAIQYLLKIPLGI